MNFEPSPGIFVKIAEGCYKVCPACTMRFWSGDGHKCDKEIWETDVWSRLMELLKTGPRIAKIIFDKILPIEGR